jgi:hypothetical protein
VGRLAPPHAAPRPAAFPAPQPPLAVPRLVLAVLQQHALAAAPLLLARCGRRYAATAFDAASEAGPSVNPPPPTPDPSLAAPAQIRNDYKRSEVALDYQAGFTAAAAGLASFQRAGQLNRCTAQRVPPKRVPDYSLCGGMGGACPSDLGGSCTDGPWPGYACAPGQVCVRDNQWAWVCKSAVPN